MNFTTLIDVPSFAKLLAQSVDQAQSPLAILDCRFDLAAPSAGREAYMSSHIPGARYADLDRVLSAPVSVHSGRHPLPSPPVLAQRLAGWDIGSDVQVVAYDDAGGAIAARAWWLLRWLGHTRVAVLDGGFKAWLASGGAVQSGAREDTTHPQRFDPQVDLQAVVSADEVLHAIEDPARLVVDARSAERYSGEVEPLDAIAGHVPGAVNHPFTHNLGTDGRFLAAEDLRRRWQQRLGGTAPANVIVMCGSGVTACHDLLALELAGFPGAKLYAGSWSEWIREPRRPVARGRIPQGL